LTFLAIIGVYLFGGFVGGAVVGLLRPVSRWWVGRRLMGVVVAVPITLGIRYAVYGWHPWSGTELENWTFTAVIWGLAMSFAPEPYVREYWAQRDTLMHEQKHRVGRPREPQV
jgi:integral membrane sensor domain MASE1